MDISEAERALQANLGPALGGQMDGFDNAAIDFGQLEDLINGGPDHVMNFEGDGVPGTPTSSISNYSQQQTHCNSQGGGHMNGQSQHHITGVHQGPAMLDILCHHNNRGSPPQRVPPAAHQPPHNPYPQQQQHTGHHGNPQQQHIINNHNNKNNQYCPQLPDSPPDSGSEPYSPPNGDHQNNGGDHQTNLNYCNNVKSNIMTSLPQQQHQHQQQQQQGMYMNPGMHGGAGGPGGPGGGPGPGGGGVSTPHTSITPPHTQISPISNPHAAQMHQRANGYNNGYMPPMPPNMGSEPPKLNHQPPIGSVPPITLNPQMLHYNVGTMNNLANHPNKKRKYESPTNTVTPGVLNSMGIPPGVQSGMINIKNEPGILTDCDDDGYPYDLCSDMSSSFLDGSYQVIKWQVYQPKTWVTLLDHNYKPLMSPSYRVDADKGFNFAGPDDAFVCQKKNHFQVTVHMELHGLAKFVKQPDSDTVKPIDCFQLHFHGVKMESNNQTIKVEQSQSDRSKRPFYPVRVDLTPDQVSKVTVGRLHFSETTTNNMRKKGKPNPDQRYFLLVVGLHAHSGDDHWPIAAQVSERIIVRASNPGQFDQDVDVTWQKGHSSDTVYHAGRVGINTDRPDEPLTVHGNVKVTGHVIQPSDRRIKTDLKELETKDQLKNISSIKVYNYGFDNKYSDLMGMAPELKDTGVIAQELREVLPDAVRETGDLVYHDGQTIDNLQVVNKDRIYMENVGAVKELCKVTDKLENRINELETMNKKLTKLGHCNKGSIKSTCSTMSLSTCSTISRTSSIPRLYGSKLDKEYNTRDKDVKELENVEKRDKSEKKSHSHHHHHHHRHHRHHSHRSAPLPAQEDGLCTNRFIHITIIVLVLVMAFCLISITTLYILERQQPASSLHTVHNNTSTNTTDSGTTVKPNIFNGGSTTLRPTHMQTDGRWPLLDPRCLRDPSTCEIVCCAITTGPTTTDRLPSTPPNDPKNHGHGGGVGPTYNITKNKDKDKNNGHNAINKPTKGPDISVVGVQPIDVQPVIDDLGYEKTSDPVVIMTDPFSGRKRRAVSDLQVKADLMILETNQTINVSYCKNQPCKDGMGANYTYTIPISQYFRLNSITLAADLADTLDMFLCHHLEYNECGNKTPEPLNHKVHSYNLPVGHYAESFYKFRVADINLEESYVCTLNKTDVGVRFAEYWVQFFRIRDDSCSAEETHSQSDCGVDCLV